MIKLLIRIAYFLCVIIQGIIGARIVLTIIGANRENEIVRWIMEKSEFLISPFTGILDKTINIYTIQIPAVLLVSMLFYIIAGIILSELLKTYREE